MELSSMEEDTLKAQWQSGIADPVACAELPNVWQLRNGQSGTAQLTGKSPTPPRLDVVKKCLGEIAEHYNTELPLYKGVFCPWDPTVLPGRYNWNQLYAVFTEILKTLKRRCNKVYVTTLTVSAIERGRRVAKLINE